MVRIVVFDSGLGSLSIIRQIQKYTKCETIYFADQINFPYGTKTKNELAKIIKKTIKFLNKKFNPDFTVIASNTPSIVLKFSQENFFTVTPPIKDAISKTVSKNIAILATRTTIQSKELKYYISKQNIPNDLLVHKIDCNELIRLVESGDFLIHPQEAKNVIRKKLSKFFKENNIDVATLSSTHLPFLNKYLKHEFPNVTFIDPAECIAKDLSEKIQSDSRNKLKIFCSVEPKHIQKNLIRLGIKNKVKYLKIDLEI